MSPSEVLSSRHLQELSQVYPIGLLGKTAPAVFRERREALLKQLPWPTVIVAPQREPGSENLWHFADASIFQDPELLYLCGINQTGTALLLDPQASEPSRRAVLFLPAKNPSQEFWNGLRLGLLPITDSAFEDDLTELKTLTGFSTILPYEDFSGTLEALAAERRLRTLGVHFHSYSDAGGKVHQIREDGTWRTAQEIGRLLRLQEVKIVSATPYLLKQRLPLDPMRIREVERAETWTEEAFRAILPLTPAFRSEHELVSRLDAEMRRRSPWGLAFPTICAAGRNACTLHYMKNDDPFPPNSLVLLDFGCRSAGMNADISRTIPVSGRFSPLQRLIYGIVLDTQKFAESEAGPQTTIRELNCRAWQKMEDLLQERFLSQGGSCERAYAEGGVKPLPGKAKAHNRQPHGLSHLIAEAEHDGDPFRLYMDEPLRPGWMFSNEPGIYGHFRIRLNGQDCDEWIGIRIEDDLLVTADGVRNLSSHLPREIDEIESLMEAHS